MYFLLFATFFLTDEFNLDTGLFTISQRVIDTTDVEGINFYILDKSEKQIHIFNADGSFRNSFGDSGQGPGEFNSPNSLVIVNNTVFVKDLNFYNSYDLKGQFLKKHKNPSSVRHHFYKMREGWIALAENYANSSGQLIWFNYSWAEKKVIHEWFDIDYSMFEARPKFNLTNTGNRLIVSKDKNYAFCKLNQQDEIWIYNEKSEDLNKISIQGQKYPCKKYSNEIVQAIAKSKPSIIQAIENGICELDFPEFFPLVKTMFSTAQNTLVVDKWPPVSIWEQKEQLADPRFREYFDTNAQAIKPTIVDKYSQFILEVTPDWIYYYEVDEESETYFIKRVDHKNSKSILEKAKQDLD